MLLRMFVGLLMDNYAEDGGPVEEVWLLFSFYHDPLQHQQQESLACKKSLSECEI